MEDNDGEEMLTAARKQAKAALKEGESILQETLKELQSARDLASKAGLSVDSYIIGKPLDIDSTVYLPYATNVVHTQSTGGYSNTDHEIVRTGDKRVDRIAELKRSLLRRHRAMQPENRGEERWDKPKIPGERRRRIVSSSCIMAALVHNNISFLFVLFLAFCQSK
jgi:hypothetical protein